MKIGKSDCGELNAILAQDGLGIELKLVTRVSWGAGSPGTTDWLLVFTIFGFTTVYYVFWKFHVSCN